MELITLLSPLPCYSLLPWSLFFLSPTLPMLGASRWLLWLSLSRGYICLQQLYSLLFTGRSAGWGPHNNKGLTLNLSPLSVGVWLQACVEHTLPKEVNGLWRTVRGAGSSCWLKWEERICSGFCSFCGELGGQSQGNARQTDGGFRSCMAPSTLSRP